jgi:RNA polymerase-interacting CarD/CdnL/TRCF family regulator
MKLLSNLLLFLLLSNIVFANDNKVIKLHNKSIDQLVKEESTKNDNLLLSIVDEDQNQISDNIVEDTDNDLNNTNQNGDLLEDSVFLLDLWQNTSSEDLAYLLKNINSVNSDILKNELILLLKSSSNPPKGFSE